MFVANDLRSYVASFLGRSHRQYFIASVFHTGSDEILAVGTAWKRGYSGGIRLILATNWSHHPSDPTYHTLFQLAMTASK